MAPQHGSNGASSADVCARTEGGAAGGTAADAADEIPVLDLSEPDPSVLASQIYRACSTWGFFQLINHGISAELVSSFRARTADFFALDYATKAKLKRDARNARGYFDDELTKRRRDWKEALDVGAPGSRDWGLPDGDGANACLDGFNRFPTEVECPGFRDVVVEYFEECAKLSDRLAALMARALGNEGDEEGPLLERMRSEHTSYLRMNYYPPGVSRDGSDGSDNNLHNNTFSVTAAGEGALGISPHRDAGFLTVLLQDDDCHSLQVARFEDDDHLGDDERWVSVRPMPGALTINTGDMAMICSNGRFRAPLHRVLTDPTRKRYSAPFFYNPGYGERMAPFRCSRDGPGEGGADAMRPKYNPCVWGYFRALRFAGDLTDLGVEIQTSHFKVGSESSHVEKQRRFMEVVDFAEPFDVEKYRANRVVVAEVDCTKHERLCRDQHIQGYPSVRVYTKSHDTLHRGYDHDHTSYHGDRTVEAITAFAEDLLPAWKAADHKDTELAIRQPVETQTVKKIDGPGCSVTGFVLVKKVPGHLWVTATSKSHSFHAESMNMTHVVHHFYFGQQLTPQRRRYLDRFHAKEKDPKGDWHDKLAGGSFTSEEDNVTHEHYLQTVLTTIKPSGSPAPFNVYEYTQHSHSLRAEKELPRAKFHFDPSPVQISVSEERQKFYHFITTLMAIIGGVYSVMGIADGFVHSGIQALRKKDLGKFG